MENKFIESDDEKRLYDKIFKNFLRKRCFSDQTYLSCLIFSFLENNLEITINGSNVYFINGVIPDISEIKNDDINLANDMKLIIKPYGDYCVVRGFSFLRDYKMYAKILLIKLLIELSKLWSECKSRIVNVIMQFVHRKYENDYENKVNYFNKFKSLTYFCFEDRLIENYVLDKNPVDYTLKQMCNLYENQTEESRKNPLRSHMKYINDWESESKVIDVINHVNYSKRMVHRYSEETLLRLLDIFDLKSSFYSTICYNYSPLLSLCINYVMVITSVAFNLFLKNESIKQLLTGDAIESMEKIICFNASIKEPDSNIDTRNTFGYDNRSDFFHDLKVDVVKLHDLLCDLRASEQLIQYIKSIVIPETCE